MPLPTSATSAAIARHALGNGLRGMGLPEDGIDDATLLVSELVSNVYRHVLGGQDHDPRVLGWAPELWVYLRGLHDSRTGQVVCKVFDNQPDLPAHADPVDPMAADGRGLPIVARLAQAWGWHVTRSRLPAQDGSLVTGKAVWFALPLPVGVVPSPPPINAADAADMLRDYLAARGLRDTIGRTDERDLSVVSVRHGLTVWCRRGIFSWAAGDRSIRVPFSDLIEAAEQITRIDEEMADFPAPASLSVERI